MGTPEVTTGDLLGLLERLEAATGADRELDARLYVSLIARLKSPHIDAMIAERARLRPDANVWLDGARDWQVKPYTASLDASLALCSRVLPGCRVMVERAFDGSGWAMMHVAPGEPRDMTEGATPALALLCAMLKALAHSISDGDFSSVARAEVAASSGVKSDSAGGH